MRELGDVIESGFHHGRDCLFQRLAVAASSCFLRLSMSYVLAGLCLEEESEREFKCVWAIAE